MYSKGVCAAKGFKASGISCGIRKKNKLDLALITSEVNAAMAGVYTKNLVQGAPIIITKKNIADGYGQAIIVNSGNANTCNDNGIEIAKGMCELVYKHTGIKNVAVGSTGIIGQKLSLNPIESGMGELVNNLGNGTYNSHQAAKSILTTDTTTKEVDYQFELDGHVVNIGGIAKGSGMIHPNMATMLGFITTDAAISPELLQVALSETVIDTFNMISVDKDTSTNDTVLVMANGLADNTIINEKNSQYITFKKALFYVMNVLAKLIAKDGEGATKVIECKVKGAYTKEEARILAKSVVCSPLIKCAIFGADANWGRVLCAIGYAGIDLDINKVQVKFKSAVGEIVVCENGMGVEYSEELAKNILLEDEIIIDVKVGSGECGATAYGCDLTYDYVKINGDYRT